VLYVSYESVYFKEIIYLIFLSYNVRVLLNEYIRIYTLIVSKFLVFMYRNFFYVCVCVGQGFDLCNVMSNYVQVFVEIYVVYP
jgi:hypothetical protein